jgi:hypothetical protein
MLHHGLIGAKDEIRQSHLGSALALFGCREILLTDNQCRKVGAPLARCPLFIIEHWS